MDLSKLNTETASEKAKVLKLRNPYNQEILKDEKGNAIELQLLGMQSKTAKNASADQKRKTKPDMSEEEAGKIGAEYLAKLTVGWSDNIELGKNKLEFNYDNAVNLYMSEDWIAAQVLQFVRDLRNYDPNA